MNDSAPNNDEGAQRSELGQRSERPTRIELASSAWKADRAEYGRTLRLVMAGQSVSPDGAAAPGWPRPAAIFARWQDQGEGWGSR